MTRDEILAAAVAAAQRDLDLCLGPPGDFTAEAEASIKAIIKSVLAEHAIATDAPLPVVPRVSVDGDTISVAFERLDGTPINTVAELREVLGLPPEPVYRKTYTTTVRFRDSR